MPPRTPNVSTLCEFLAQRCSQLAHPDHTNGASAAPHGSCTGRFPGARRSSPFLVLSRQWHTATEIGSCRIAASRMHAVELRTYSAWGRVLKICRIVSSIQATMLSGSAVQSMSIEIRILRIILDSRMIVVNNICNIPLVRYLTTDERSSVRCFRERITSPAISPNI